MLKYFRNHFGMIISVVIALLLSLCMSSTASIRAASAENPLTVEKLISNWGTAFLTIMMVSIFLPSKVWGDKLAGAIGLKQGTLPFGLVSNLVPTLFYNTAATFVLVGVNVGWSAPYYWSAFWGDYLLMFVISYVLSLVAERLGMIIAMKAVNPAGAANPNEPHV